MNKKVLELMISKCLYQCKIRKDKNVYDKNSF